MWLMLALVCGALLGGVWLSRAHHAQNHAGIITRRRLTLMTLLGRGVAREAWLRIRMRLANRARRDAMRAEAQLLTAQEAAARLGSMKGVMMKLGQIVSFAHDGLPADAQAPLQRLQQQAPPMVFTIVEEVVRRELGPGTLAWLDATPLAAASIGQVHKATLSDGTSVVIKVQYPGVDAAISADLATLERGGPVAKLFAGGLDVGPLVDELKARITDELDYRKEAANQALFHALWEGHPSIRVPRVWPALGTKHVLVSEFAQGVTYYDFLKIAGPTEKLRAAAAIADFVWDSMFCHLIYNGDPHPGNYLFDARGGVTFLDFGCVKHFELARMLDLKRFFQAILENDQATHDAYVIRLGLVMPGRAWDRDRMWRFWRYQLEPYYSGNFTFTPEYLARARAMLAREHIQDMNLPPDMLFFTRITFGLNAIAAQLGTTGDFSQSVRRQFYGEGPSALELVGVADIPQRFIDLPREAPGERAAATRARLGLELRP